MKKRISGSQTPDVHYRPRKEPNASEFMKQQLQTRRDKVRLQSEIYEEVTTTNDNGIKPRGMEQIPGDEDLDPPSSAGHITGSSRIGPSYVKNDAQPSAHQPQESYQNVQPSGVLPPPPSASGHTTQVQTQPGQAYVNAPKTNPIVHLEAVKSQSYANAPNTNPILPSKTVKTHGEVDEPAIYGDIEPGPVPPQSARGGESSDEYVSDEDRQQQTLFTKMKM